MIYIMLKNIMVNNGDHKSQSHEFVMKFHKEYCYCSKKQKYTKHKEINEIFLCGCYDIGFFFF